MTSEPDVKTAVSDLQTTIKETDVDGEKESVLSDIEAHVDELDHDSEDDLATLKEKLQGALLHFDAEHHGLVQSMQITINSLSNAGV
jgi:hypothetical protein